MNNYTDITIMLDKSGSMRGLVDDTIGGFNTFLEQQRQAAQATGSRCELQLIQFDDKYEPGQRYEVHHHPLLSRDGYVPRGQTALLDAIGRSINDTGRRLAAMPEEKRPNKVLFVVLTDGLENASKEFSASDIHEKVTLQQQAYKWDFIFLGSNMDAWAVGAQYGFQPGKTLSTAATPAGTQHAFRTVGVYAAATQAAADANAASKNKFSEEDIRRALHASNMGTQSHV